MTTGFTNKRIQYVVLDLVIIAATRRPALAFWKTTAQFFERDVSDWKCEARLAIAFTVENRHHAILAKQTKIEDVSIYG